MPVVDLRMSSTQPLSLALAPPSRGRFLCPSKVGPLPALKSERPLPTASNAPISQQRPQPSWAKLRKKSDGRIDKCHKDIKSAGPIGPAPCAVCHRPFFVCVGMYPLPITAPVRAIGSDWHGPPALDHHLAAHLAWDAMISSIITLTFYFT